MPELPEVETMRRGVLPIIGSRIVAAQRTPCKKRPIEIRPRIDRLNRRVVDQKIVAVDRLGKRVVIVVENGDRILFEPRMTGLVLIESPPSEEHLRFELILKSRQVDRLLFWDRRGLGKICCLNEDEFFQLKHGGTLGPDALEITADQLRENMRSSKQPIKVALLDQKKVLGVGNLYASEILHLCGIDPRARCDRLIRRQWDSIHDQMIRVLREAIKYEGSTLSDGTYRNALNDPGEYQNHHRVYDRESDDCPSCGNGKIVRIVQAQRSTFFCPKCQKKR